jgi:hypothetical protein
MNQRRAKMGNQQELLSENQGERTIPIHEAKLEYSQADLEAKALEYVRENKPKEYRKMKKSGELDEYCRLAAKAAREFAQTLIASGVWDHEAWPRAIRQEILERPTSD